MINDPSYPQQMFFVGVGSSPISQADADNQAVSAVQKSITVTVRVSQESGMSSKRQGNSETVKRYLESRATMNTRGDLQGADIVKRYTKGNTFMALCALSKSKFAAQKRMNMKEAAKSIVTLADQAKVDADANKIADALSVRSRIEERIRTFEQERVLLSAAESLLPGDTVPVNVDALNKIFDASLKKLSIAAVSGGEQSLVDPAQGLLPWTVLVTALEVPIAEMPLKLVSPDRKIVRTAITDAQGQAIFYPDAYVGRAAGEQVWKVMADLQVSRSQMDILDRKRADFRVTITPMECKVKIQASGIPVAAARTELVKTLANYGFKDDPSAKKTLIASTSVLEKGFSQGLSDATSFAMLEVSLALEVKDAAGRSLQSTIGKAMGTGNRDAAVVAAIKKMQLGPDASLLSKAACGDGSPAKPLPTLAVLPFNAPRTWYSDEAKASLLADMVAGAIHRAEAYQIVERTRLAELVTEQTTGQSGLIADPVEMGQLLGAQFVMMGTLLGDWDSLRVEGKIVDSKTGAVVKTFSATGSLETISGAIAKQIL
jgi:TolB-like protein